MSESRLLLRAPGRGQYDRRQSREERLGEQRARLMAATALAAAEGGTATVARVVKLAGTSRNTFYEYFDDAEHALAAAEERSRARLEHALGHALGEARTPVERLRALARAWVAWGLGEPAEARWCLSKPEGALGAAGQVLERALTRALAASRAAGVQATEHDSLRVIATAAAGEALLRRVLSAAQSSDAERERAANRCEKALVDVAVRLLR